MNAHSFPAPLDDDVLAQTWQDAWLAIGTQAPTRLRGELERAWSEPQRHYHDGRHLRECLAFWWRWHGHCEHSGEVAIALWFHDAVYLPDGESNEAKSAVWAVRSLEAEGAERDVSRRVHHLIMATCHAGPGVDSALADAGENPDVALLLDIDLAILGSPPRRFWDYERDVREEYAAVPASVYRAKRAELLELFLSRPRLYKTRPAFELLEAQARVNLREALLRLRA
ncbi:MAG: N-methyl-D-aspartate receptor NMDAR2C subunit [Burkholderiales bacterium]